MEKKLGQSNITHFKIIEENAPDQKNEVPIML